MYLQGKLNQNAHITLRALKDWQQLNLSVKNLVKELKTFDLPMGKMILPSRGGDINGILPLLLLSCFFHVKYIFLKHICTQLCSVHASVCVCLLWFVNACTLVFVHVCVCICGHVNVHVRANRRMSVCMYSLSCYVHVCIYNHVCVWLGKCKGDCLQEAGR